MKLKKMIMLLILTSILAGCEGSFDDMINDANKADAALQSVTIKNSSTSADISFNFSRGVTSYRVNAGTGTDSVNITAVPAKSGSTMQYRVDGGTWSVMTGTQTVSGLLTAAGLSKKAEINVTSVDGKESVLYSFTVSSQLTIALTTTIVTNIHSISATAGGNITNDAGLSITSRGVCWSTGNNTTISDSKTVDGSGAGSFTSNISGLIKGGTVYYVRAYATSSTGSTDYGDEVSLTTCGYTGPGGGLVFYDRGLYTTGDPNGDWRYLEAAPVNQGYVMWTISSLISTLIGTTGTAVGTGKANTIAIIAQVNNPSETNYAAAKCTAYSNNGKSDWFLPSKEELHLIYTNLYLLGLGSGYATDNYYYSSSEVNYNMVWLHGFAWGSGGQGANDKGYSGYSRYVRAIRAY